MKRYLSTLYIHSFSKTILWGIGNACYGLAPFLFVGFLFLLGINNKVTLKAHQEFDHFISDGSIVYFFCALMGACSVDLFLARKKFADNMAFLVVFIGSSILILFLVITVYLVLLYSEEKQQGFRDVPRFQVIITAITGFFSILAKAILFIKEKQEVYDDYTD